MKAIWKDTVLAESEETVVVDGNHYFPPSSVDSKLLRASKKKTVCGWKGEASYSDVVVGEAVNRDAVWTYPKAKPEAQSIEGYLAFWNGVEVVD